MKGRLFIFVFLCFSKGICQEIILNTDFTVRDFQVIENTLLYIEKRHVKSFNLKSKTKDTLIGPSGFFIGGYGLKLYYDKENKKVVTSSNELIMDRSSVRFYDIIKKEINKYHVYYTTELMDFFIVPRDSLFFLSKKDKQIEIFKYGGVPRYNKIDSVKLKSYSRKLNFHHNNLYYITDLGEVFVYNIITQTKKSIFKTKTLLVNFIFDRTHENLYVTTFDGKLIKINIEDNFSPKIINVGNSIIEAIEIVDDSYIIIGDWNGEIKLINIDTLEIVKEFHNKKRIVKILATGGYFYTSSSDKTIKRWKLN